MKLTKTQQEILRQKQFIPDGIQGDEGFVKVEITDNIEEMIKGERKGEIKAGYFNSKKKLIKLLLGDEMDKFLLHEWLHQTIFSSGFKEHFKGVEEEVFVKILTRAVRQYLTAMQLNYLKNKEKKK